MSGWSIRRVNNSTLSNKNTKKKIKFSDIDKLIIEDKADLNFDIFDILFSTKDPKELYKKLLTKKLNADYIQRCILYGIIIRPKLTDCLLKVYCLFGFENGSKRPKNYYLNNFLTLIGMNKGPLPICSYKDFIKLFNDNGIKEAIVNDNVKSFRRIVNSPDFEFDKNAPKDSFFPLYYVEKGENQQSKKSSYMKLIAFFGAEKCFKEALHYKKFSLEGIEKYAVAGGNKEIIETLISDGFSFKDCYRVSVKFHRYEISQMLLENGRCEELPLEYTIKHFNTRAFYFNIKNNIRVMESTLAETLIAAAKRSNLEVVRYLYEKCHARACALEIAARPWVLSDDKTGRTALCVASSEGNLDVVKYLVNSCKVDPNEEDLRGGYALKYACKKGWLNVVKFLVENCHVDIEKEGISEEAVLNIAFLYNRIAVAEYLVNVCHARTNVISKDTKQRTFKKGNVNTVIFLLDACHISPNNRDEDGYTPLHLACKESNFEVIKYLINDLRVDIEEKTLNGYNALYFAIKSNNLEIVKYLIEECHAKVFDEKGKPTFPYDIIDSSCNVINYFGKKYHYRHRLKLNI